LRRYAWIVPCLALAWSCHKTEEAPAEKKETKGEEEKAIALSDEALKAAAIKVVEVSRVAFSPHLVASAVIRPDAQRSVIVRARTAGRLLSIRADVGTKVEVGQTLATLEGPDVTAALARYRTAAAREDVAKKGFERAERLVAIQAISRADRDARRAEAAAAEAEAEAARQDLVRLGLDPKVTPSDPGNPTEFAVVSPMAGIVLERSATPFLLVDKDAPLFTVAELSHVWAVADVYEKDLGQIQEKGEVAIRSDAYPQALFKGQIALVEPALDEGARMGKVRVVLDNASGRLRPGLFVTAELPLKGAQSEQAIAVPSEAIQMVSGLPTTFVEKTPGHFEVRPVETGRTSQGLVEIRRGLEEGDKVVVQGAFILKSELLKSTIEAEK